MVPGEFNQSGIEDASVILFSLYIGEGEGTGYFTSIGNESDIEAVVDSAGAVIDATWSHPFADCFSGPDPTPVVSSNDTAESMSWIIPVIYVAALIAVSATVLFAGGFSVASLIIVALFMIIGLALLGTMTTMLSNMW